MALDLNIFEDSNVEKAQKQGSVPPSLDFGDILVPTPVRQTPPADGSTNEPMSKLKEEPMGEPMGELLDLDPVQPQSQSHSTGLDELNRSIEPENTNQSEQIKAHKPDGSNASDANIANEGLESESLTQSLKAEQKAETVAEVPSKSVTVLYEDSSSSLDPKSAFVAIAQKCDVETLKALLFVSKASFEAVTSDTIWTPVCDKLGIPDEIESSDLIQVSNNDPAQILQVGRVNTHECVSYNTFRRAYNVLKPVLFNSVQEKDADADADPEGLLHRARVLSNANRLVATLPSLFPEDILKQFGKTLSNEESRLLDIISDCAVTKSKLSSKILSACEVYFDRDRVHFRDKVISTYFSHLLLPPDPREAFAIEDSDSFESDPVRTVSKFKLEQAFGKTMSALIQVNAEISSGDSILPPKWNKTIWNYMAYKLIGELVIYMREVLDEASRNISEEAYLAAVPIFCQSSAILTENSLVNEIGKKFDLDFADHVKVYLLQPFIDEYSERQTKYVETFARMKVKQWNQRLLEREDEAEKYIWSSVPKKSDKFSFMSSFKWAFMSSNDEEVVSEEANNDAAAAIGSVSKAPSTEFEAQTAVLLSKLKGMESLVSMELVIEVMETCRNAIKRLRAVSRVDSKRCQMIFITFLKEIGDRHIKPAFERALTILNSYDPKKYGRLMVSMNKAQNDQSEFDGRPENDRSPVKAADDIAVEPLVIFTELVNVGDIVQQMVHVFFEEELISSKLVRKSDFGAPSVNAKRNFEQMLDDNLAAGLSRGIDVLMDQVEFTLVTEQLGSDYLPLPVDSSKNFGTTKAAENVISLVRSHLSLLRETTEKSLYEVFQHEVGVRLYSALSKHIKRQTISEEGAITLIADVNAYYNFILSLRQRSLQPYYETLKQISQLYLIDKKDAKQIGLAMGDSARYNGLVTTEDLMEFVKRRQDWPSIKSKVEKTLYGVLECVIC